MYIKYVSTKGIIQKEERVKVRGIRNSIIYSDHRRVCIIHVVIDYTVRVIIQSKCIRQKGLRVRECG